MRGCGNGMNGKGRRTVGRRLTIDLTDNAQAEIERMCEEMRCTTPDLFRAAVSVLRVHNKQLDEIAEFASCNHADQPREWMMHALSVDIPAMCERFKVPNA